MLNPRPHIPPSLSSPCCSRPAPLLGKRLVKEQENNGIAMVRVRWEVQQAQRGKGAAEAWPQCKMPPLLLGSPRGQSPRGQGQMGGCHQSHRPVYVTKEKSSLQGWLMLKGTLRCGAA